MKLCWHKWKRWSRPIATTTTFPTVCPDCARLKALLADVFPVIDNALNYFYPLRSEDGDKAMDARARLFELRDKIKTKIKHEGIE